MSLAHLTLPFAYTYVPDLILRVVVNTYPWYRVHHSNDEVVVATKCFMAESVAVPGIAGGRVICETHLPLQCRVGEVFSGFSRGISCIFHDMI
jgi:hypothetical protein